MTHTHKLKKVIFDIRFQSKETMLAQQSAIAGTIKQHLMPAVEAILAEHALGSHAVRIDRLQVDLGKISSSNVRFEAPRRLQGQLDTALKKKIESLRKNPSANEGIIPLPLRELELVTHFLLSGSLPWMTAKDGRSLEQRLQVVLDKAAGQFVNFLHNNATRQPVLQRLVRQFSPKAVNEIIHMVAPGRAENYLDLTENVLVNQAPDTAGIVDESEAAALKKELVLSFLLHNRRKHSSSRAFERWATEWIARRIGAKSLSSRQTTTGSADADQGLVRHGPDAKIGSVLPALLQKPAEHLGQLVETVQQYPESGLQITTQLTEHLNHQLIKALLASVSSESGRHAAVFIEAVENFAARTNDRALYYAEILKHIVKGRSIDLQKISEKVSAGQAQDLPGAPSNFGKPGPWTHAKPNTDRQTPADNISDAKTRLLLLPDSNLARKLQRMQPQYYPQIQAYTDLVVDTPYVKQVFDRQADRRAYKWEFIFTDPAVTGDVSFEAHGFIRRLLGFMASKTRPQEAAIFYEALDHSLTAVKPVAPSIEYNTVLQELMVMVRDRKVQSTKTAITSDPFRFDQTLAATTETVVANAGLVIAAPYLPRLWTMLALTKDGDFRNLQAAERAAHLLQFMADARTETPEHELVLNKILCGIEISTAICKSIDITDAETETIEGLINGMIANWKTIGNTSVAGFRESFLQRRGRLVLKENGWHLKVEQRAFDMLLDKMPWSFTTINQGWMAHALHVIWR